MSEGENQFPSAFAENLQRARDAYAANDLAACRGHLEGARALEPSSLELKRWQARLAWREGDWRTLGEVAANYLEARPSDREMVQLRARALSNSRQWRAATGAWRRMTELRPEWPEGWYQLARAQLRADLPHAAARSAERLRSFAGNDALIAAARLAVERGRMSEAVEMFSRLAADAPARVEEEFRSCEEKGDHRAALVAAIGLAGPPGGDAYREISKAIAQDLFQRAVVHERRGDAAEAYLDYAALAQIEPGDILAKNGIKRTMQFLHDAAKQQIAADERDLARRTYLRILYCQPSDGRALAALGQMQMADHEWLMAVEVWESLLMVSPGDPRVLVQRARALDRAQEFAAALAAWRAVLSVEADNIEAQVAVSKLPTRIVKAGRMAVEERRYVEAASILSLVPSDDPAHADAIRRLEQVFRHLHKEMRIAYKERQFDRVVAYGAVAGSIVADNQDVQRLLAQAAMRTHDYTIAANAWIRLIALTPSTRSSASLQLARCHLHLGCLEEGRSVLDGLLRDEPNNVGARALALEFQDAPSKPPQVVNSNYTI